MVARRVSGLLLEWAVIRGIRTWYGRVAHEFTSERARATRW